MFKDSQMQNVKIGKRPKTIEIQHWACSKFQRDQQNMLIHLQKKSTPNKKIDNTNTHTKEA